MTLPVGKTEPATPRPAKPLEILVATDFSDVASAALRVAADYARRLGGRLHLFHVTSPVEHNVTRLLADAADEAGVDVPATLASVGGDAPDEIVRYAARHSIDLIVLGTHGRTGVSRLLLGSVAERVVRTARCPVLTVPLARAAAAASDPVTDVPAAPAPSSCLVCAKPSRDLICAPCRAHIRGEALVRKQREERAGGV
jgi:nucleotide-binding universal stress UspA family protein